MDNQHKQITGYRDLSQEEIEVMNAIKAHAETTRELVERVNQFLQEQPEPEAPQTVTTDSFRWVSIARTELQQGYMALIRAVAKQTTF